ncbi:MAG: SulP family inorganic anion transporter [Deltaproteobacteria bacterium]|nr:SulP family inorganic anion transporter [Deltaproteobacteria bacterium]
MPFLHYLSFLDLRSYRLGSLRKDFAASVTVSFLDIPQGIAYAMIAGLPPVMGLYAAAVPAIVGALFRSSRHVVTGPTNALSLLVGSAVAAEVARSGAAPMEVGVTLAFCVGVLQMSAGVLRLDAFVDFLSQPVIRGYITGAATLIIAGQLTNITGTPGASGDLIHTLATWSRGLPYTNGIAVAFALGTVFVVVGLRHLGRHLPGAIVAMVLSILISHFFQLHEHGLRLVSDLAPIPAGLPPLTVPHLALWTTLAPAALACAVLSLVESSSVARDLAARSRQQLDMAAEFFGQGTANTAAAFFGGYPISGSLGRSALNQQSGAESRLAAVFCGSLTLLVLLFLGPLVGHTPVASLAGLLLVLANDLIDRDRIRLILRGTLADRAGFLFTLLGAWILPLDRAIYLGVGISIVLFLRRARLLSAREMAIGEKGRFREVEPGSQEAAEVCPAIRILNLAGPLFFAVVGELERALEPFVQDQNIRVLIVRLRQAENADITTVSVLEATAQKLASEGRTLILLGLRRGALTLLEQTGLAQLIGRENMFLAQAGWFTAMEAALQRALALTGEHACGAHCPLAEYLADQQVLRLSKETEPLSF